MRSSTANLEFELRATKVKVSDELLTVEFDDGRSVSEPVQWYPRLAHGTAKERANCEIDAFGIHWPDLDEELSYKGLSLGWRSGENPELLNFWLENRKKGRRVTFQDWMKQRPKKVPKAVTTRRLKTA
jgi:hypothetical protein